MKLAKRVAVAVILVLSLPGVAQAISISQSGVSLAPSRHSIDLGGRVTLHGFVYGSRHCRPHHYCPPPPPPPHCRPHHYCPPPPPPHCRPHHHHLSITIYRNGVAVAAVPMNATGRFSYRYRADASTTWSAMFGGERCDPHPDRTIVYASVSRAVTVTVTLNGEALRPGPRPRL